MSGSGDRQASGTRRVYSGLEVGTSVRYRRFLPGRGREERTGEITEVDESRTMSAFARYKVEFDGGWAMVPANKIEEVLT